MGAQVRAILRGGLVDGNTNCPNFKVSVGDGRSQYPNSQVTVGDGSSPSTEGSNLEDASCTVVAERELAGGGLF